MDAHLFFDRAAGNPVARSDGAVLRRQEFRDDEKRNSLGALGRALDAGEHEMDDVLGQIVLAGGNENLGAGDFVGAVRLRHRAGAHKTEIGAALRLGQVHRAGPLAADELGQVERLLLGGGVGEDRRGRALREARIHGKGHVRRAKKFADGLRERHRQALAAEFGRRRGADPAAFGQPLVGVLESGRRGHRAVRLALAAFLVADAIERRQHVLAEFRRFFEHRLDQIGRGVGKARQVVVAIDVEHIAQQEHHVANRCLVSRHVALPAVRSSAQPRRRPDRKV